MPVLGSDLLKGSLRHGYPSAVEVFLQSLVEFCEPPKLQLGHGLLLALAIVVCADFVGSGHGGGEGARERRLSCRVLWMVYAVEWW